MVRNKLVSVVGVNPPADIASGRIAEVRSRSMSCNCMTRTSQQECRGILESKETAEAMAKACTKAYKANIGIGVTGTMGNADPANLEASVPGQVYFAIELNGEVMSYYLELQTQPTRLAYKLAVAKEIYDALMERL